jgi:ureidoacrylate peracid hydrolase
VAFYGPLIKEIAPNMLAVLLATRAQAYECSSRRTTETGDPRMKSRAGSTFATIQKFGHERRIFGAGTWGGTFREEFTPLPGEVVAQEHWCSSGFVNTDLDLPA